MSAVAVQALEAEAADLGLGYERAIEAAHAGDWARVARAAEQLGARAARLPALATRDAVDSAVLARTYSRLKVQAESLLSLVEARRERDRTTARRMRQGREAVGRYLAPV